MRHFLKAIRLSLRHKWTIAGSVITALLIGVLWGASISAVYPFVEVVFQGATAETWVDDEIASADQSVKTLTDEIQGIERDIQQADPETTRNLAAQLAIKKDRRKAEQKASTLYRSLKPKVHDWLPKTPFGTLIAVMSLLVASTFFKGVLLVINQVLVTRIANSTVLNLRRMLYHTALRMDQAEFDKAGTSEVMTRISHNVNLVGAGLRSLYGKSIREPLKMVACFVGAACISWRLLALSLLIAPIGVFCIHHLAQRMKESARREMGGWARVLHTLMETLNGVRIVKIFRRERGERCRFKNDARTLYRRSMKIAFYDALVRPVTELVGILILVVAILAGAYLVLNQETHLFGIRISDRPLSGSLLFVFYAMLAGVSDPARKMSDIYNTIVRAALASNILFDMVDAKPTITASENQQPVPTHSNSIRFESVNFGYRPLKGVLHQVSLEIPFGQTVAIVGENGCGKSTLVNLLARFYDPKKGAIYLDDVNLSDLNPRKLRGQMALVSQDPLLFRGTVWDNIAYAAPHASRDRVLGAARIACVDQFIEQLPNGYDTKVGDQGKFLSGGQRQRVALARAVLADPRILLLDEATSQLDIKTEQAVCESLREYLTHRTTIVITHRRSLLEISDRVIVMSRGRIVEDVKASEYLRRSRPLRGGDKFAA